MLTIILIVGSILILFILVSIIIIYRSSPKGSPKPIPVVMDKYLFSSNYNIIDKRYYRLGTKDKSKDVQHIIDILDEVINSIRSEEIKTNLLKDRPIFLVGNSPRDFTEFDIVINSKTIDNNRNIADLTAFSTNTPLPGFISDIYNECRTIYRDEDILTHEFLHAIMNSGFTSEQRIQLENIYTLYKPQYAAYEQLFSIFEGYDSVYAFLTSEEFFAIMGQIFFELTSRLDDDSTGGINKQKLQTTLPQMYQFLDQIFNSENSVRNKSCILNCGYSYC